MLLRISKHNQVVCVCLGRLDAGVAAMTGQLRAPHFEFGTHKALAGIRAVGMCGNVRLGHAPLPPGVKIQ